MVKKLYRFLHPKFQSLSLDYKVDFKPRYGHGLPAHKQLNEIIERNRSTYSDLLNEFLELRSKIHTIQQSDQEKDTKLPAWNNNFLPGLDMVGIYGMLNHFKPERYVEIGSGNSTKVVRKAIQDNKLNTKIISIDPMPRAEIDDLADEVQRVPFETIDNSFFAGLKANDIVFVDNSHRVLPNSDATVFFLEVLPILAKGVVVHVHDIYLPYDYPQFMCDRFYSEQYMLAAFILANPNRYKTILPNYFISEDAALKKQIEPMWEHPNLQGVERHGGSYWLQING